MNEILASVKKTETPFGTAMVWWLGQMGLMIKLGDTVLCADYFASETPGRRIAPPIPAEEMDGIDLFLGSHDHLDHMDHEAWKIWTARMPKAGFVFPRAHDRAVGADGVKEANRIGMNDGESRKIGGVTIRTVAAAHEFLDQDPETGLYPCLQYIIEGNGVRIYHAGDTLRYEGMLPKLRALGPVDAALLPINGRDAARYRRNCIGNMTFQESADLAGELGIRLALPGHWDMFADNPGDPQAFMDYLDAKYGKKVRCLIPEYGKPILITGNG